MTLSYLDRQTRRDFLAYLPNIFLLVEYRYVHLFLDQTQSTKLHNFHYAHHFRSNFSNFIGQTCTRADYSKMNENEQGGNRARRHLGSAPHHSTADTGNKAISGDKYKLTTYFNQIIKRKIVHFVSFRRFSRNITLIEQILQIIIVYSRISLTVLVAYSRQER